MNQFIDLNCDMGESYGTYNIGCDDKIMPLITSANIACGFHAGDPSVMRKTVELAKKHSVAIGAHPGFPDLNGFGRRNMSLSYDELFSAVVYQIGALAAFCSQAKVRLTHVKPHGALYNMAAKDLKIAEAIAAAIQAVDDTLIYFGQARSEMIYAARNLNLGYACEIFADRAYNNDGTLVARTLAGAVIHDDAAVTRRIVKLVTSGKIDTIDKAEITLLPTADLQLGKLTVCVHGDNPDAYTNLKSLRQALAVNDIGIRGIKA